MSTATVIKTLTAADRCDRCGAQAKVRAMLTSGELLFCGHHGAAYMKPLVEVALEVVDEGAIK